VSKGEVVAVKLMPKRFVPALVLVGAITLTGCATPESSFPTKANDARRAAGKGPLSAPAGTAVADRARFWSAAMCQRRALSHSSPGYYPGGWAAIGENVGAVGWNANDQNSWTPNTDRLWTSFMNSSGHRANILGNYTQQVVGQYVCDDGKIYVTHVFLR
jgi:uncharacterized protein YkwD